MNDKNLPPFQIVAGARGFLSDAEMDQLIADHASLLSQSKLGTGQGNAEVRRSQAVGIGKRAETVWLYRRLWEAAQEFNRRFFGVDISGIEGNIQLARYDSSDRGFYDWHPDFSQFAPGRKISFSVQLSRPEDYEGGDLELLFRGQPYQAEKGRGTLIAFPSFALHRVAPVTRGTRWSLAAWISGALALRPARFSSSKSFSRSDDSILPNRIIEFCRTQRWLCSDFFDETGRIRVLNSAAGRLARLIAFRLKDIG